MPKKGQTMTEATKRLIRRSQTKYKETYCGELLDYFLVIRKNKKFREEIPVKQIVDGKVRNYSAPVYVPRLTGFCEAIGISLTTFYKWVDTYPDFRDAYEEAMEIKRETLQSYALIGVISPNFAKYMLESWKPHQTKEEKRDGEGVEFRLTVMDPQGDGNENG